MINPLIKTINDIYIPSTNGSVIPSGLYSMPYLIKSVPRQDQAPLSTLSINQTNPSIIFS